MRRNGHDRGSVRRDAALSELRERAEEIRDAVRVRVLTAGNLRRAAESANETAEDVAQAVFLKLWALVRDGNPDAIADLKAYAKRMADNHVTSLVRRPIVSRTHSAEPDTLDRLPGGPTPSTTPEEALEHALSAAQVESIVASLSHTQRLLLKMRAELGMTVPEMAQVVGESQKSCAKQLERAIEKVRAELAAATDLDAADRRRLSRVMAAKRWGTPALVAGLQRDMRGDMRLASLWRQSNGAVHDVAGAVVVDESLNKLHAGPGLTERAVGLVEKGREALTAGVGRGGPEHEAAAGTAAGSAGILTKAVVAACIAAPAAGGACVATGVVEVPGGEDARAEATVPDEEAGTLAAPVAEQPAPAPTVATVSPPPEKPAQRVNTQLGLAEASKAGSSSGTPSRDFAAPPAGSGGGSSGGSGKASSAFGFER